MGLNDQREAVNIGVTLSTQIIAASLAMIAVVGASAVFILDKRTIGLLYYILVGSSFVFFILSIILGGKGINRARNLGFNGNWSIEETKSFFNRQSIAALIGTLLFAFSTFLGSNKPDDINKKIDSIEKEVIELRTQIQDYQITIEKLNIKIDTLPCQNKPIQ